MKLIFGGGWYVFVGFISILLLVCFCPVCFLEQRSSSVQKNKIFTWRNAKKGLFFINCLLNLEDEFVLIMRMRADI